VTPQVFTLTYLFRPSQWAGDPGAVYLARKTKKYCQGRFTSAGGRLESGESIRQGALREIAEESEFGLRLEPACLSLKAVLRVKENNQQRLIFVLAAMATEEIAVQPGADFEEGRWYTLDHRHLPFIDEHGVNQMPEGDLYWLINALSGDEGRVSSVEIHFYSPELSPSVHVQKEKFLWDIDCLYGGQPTYQEQLSFFHNVKE
jgi:ADP-ribose pyrophosphatase YjhB (NUDIX family)